MNNNELQDVMALTADPLQFSMTLLLMLSATFILSWLCTAMMVRLGRQHLMDVPVARSAHSTATPRGGGLAIALACSAYIVLLTVMGILPVLDMWVLLCALAIALVGLLDDLHALRVRIRLPLHLITATLVLLLLGSPPEPFFGGWLMLPSIVQAAILIIALVWLLNLYNFMDGIDTLAAGQCLFVTGASAFFLWQAHDPVAWVSFGLFAATAGFLLWNLPPARIFLGDVGSTYLGFVLGLLGLLTHYNGTVSVWVWVLLMSTFIADTTYTLLRRLISGLSVTQGHSTHSYQRLARRSGNHARVALIYLLVNLCWSLPMAWLAFVYPEHGVALAVAGVVPLMALAALLGAGTEG